MPSRPPGLSLSLADESDRASIYAIRHQVYARELGQHAENPARALTDRLDEVNVYLVAKRGHEVAGFVSITPPNELGYSVDKYFRRDSVPLLFDDGLYEIRLLTVVNAERATGVNFLLMYSALRYIESGGGRRVVAIGRREVTGMYRRAGLKSLGMSAQAGAVTYDLMAADVGDLRANLPAFAEIIQRLERSVDWRLNGVPFRPDDGCFHGGAFWEAIGDEFETLGKENATINADVLDAWFDPAPSVVSRINACLPFALKTSPPARAEGMRRAIARARGIGEAHVLPAAGSSDLIFAGLQHWITAASRVLILDPMYGEYAHVLERVIGLTPERFPLSRARQYDVDCARLGTSLRSGYDWVVLVNPNSPTGRHVPRRDLEALLSEAPAATRFWIDETYVDYLDAGESIEQYAASSSNVVVCKSMSKVYGLSGARAAYLCGPRALMDEIQRACPPWSVSLPAQIAACAAVEALDYYRARWRDTASHRRVLGNGLERLGWDVVPGCANFLLCHLPRHGPTAAAIAARTRARGLFVREVANMGRCFDAHVLRVAVKDGPTNQRILAILHETLAELDDGTSERTNGHVEASPATP